MNKISEAIYNYIQGTKTEYNADLVDRWSVAMETQGNVAADNGEPVDGKRSTYADDEYEWWNFRIPKNAADKPTFRDYNINWPLDLHIEGLGMTGWDWKSLRSRWVGFDFDSITGHAKGVGITDEELRRVREAAENLPYVEVRKSTGGGGIHLYVYFDDKGIPTQNHTEHAALARCILGMMSSEVNFDFASQIDCCGGNMWFWHRKMSIENEGLKILKQAPQTLSQTDLPSNWKDHIEVITRKRSKVRVHAELKDEHLDPFETLASARRIIPLDDTHKEIIDELAETGFTTIWVPDHHLLQTHTKALEKLMEGGKIKGIFRTISEGNDPGTPNCFMFPLGKGGWRVFRFSPGVSEAETWTQDGEGWTNCYFNRKPNLTTACRATGGVEDERGGFVFTSAEEATKAALLLGAKIDVDKAYSQRQTTLRAHKDGRLISEIEKTASDGPLQGYVSKKTCYVKIHNAFVTEEQEDSVTDPNDYLRKATTTNGDDAGWYIERSGGWGRISFTDAKVALVSDGHSKTDADKILGYKVKDAWKLVNLPFGPEYPGGRQWNLGAAQFSCQPVVLADGEIPHHPHWDLIFNDTFRTLSQYLKNLPWAKEAGIFTGGDYARHWLACALREPYEPLPYLFLYGEEDSGKSIIHEAISLLVTKGVVKADRALTANNDFNGELANAVFAIIEEKDLSKHPGALNRIREWVTNRSLSIRRMRTDTYEQPSTLHFIQCSNWFGAYPCFPGETRAMVIHVPRFKGELIPKKILLEELRKEAPHFLRTLLDIKLPPSTDRLRLPLVDTEDKKELADEVAPVNRFLAECCELKEGARTIKMKLFNAYNMWAIENGFEEMHISNFGKELMAVSKNRIRAKGQKTDKDGKLKHTYEGVSLANAV